MSERSIVKFGSLELGPIDFLIIILAGYISYKLIKRVLFVGYVKKPMKNLAEPMAMQDLTENEVKLLRENDDRCLVVVNGQIFDMSPSRILYQANLSNIEHNHLTSAKDWEAYIKRKYAFVGNIVSSNDQKCDYQGKISKVL